MAEGISRQALSALIASIYDCALDPSRWEQTLGELRQLLESETAMLGVLDVRQNRFIIAETAGLQAYGQSQVAQHAQEIAAILGDHLASISSLDEPFLMSRHLSPAYLETSSYKRVLDTQGLVDIMDYHLAHSITLIADIGFGRHERQGIFTNREIELGGLLLPHLRRSLTISNILDARTVEHERLAGVLDALRWGSAYQS